MNATFTSVVFLHLLHSGGTTLRQIFKKQLCEEGYGLHCWEGHGKGGIPKPFEARRPLQALKGRGRRCQPTGPLRGEALLPGCLGPPKGPGGPGAIKQTLAKQKNV